MAPQGSRAEANGPTPPSRTHSRTQSMSSDRPSMTGFGGLLSPPLMTNPEPIYIAASAASQIVTNDHDNNSEAWFDQHGIEPSGETALVNPAALRLVNSFLDQLLFNFLSVSRSTSLASLRPAVSEVLKPKLAKDAIGLADGELLEYLGGGEDEELLTFHNGLEPSGDWDLELVWKRTRLRCMVYSSLGDMEEEDEDHYTELEQLDGPPGLNNRFSSNPGVVSPAVAIFLTSILEFMSEQVLVVAGQASYDRLRLKCEKDEREGTTATVEIADRVVVNEMDMERVALDRTLGRLWRGWKKRIRSPAPSISMVRSFSRESIRSRGHSRIGSMSNEPIRRVDQGARELSTAPLSELARAASIPLPMNEDDVREIEIPGVAYQSDDEDGDLSADEDAVRPRPRSMIVPRVGHESLTPGSLLSQPPPSVSAVSKKRSNSLPSLSASGPFSSPKRSKKTAADDETGTAQQEISGEEHVEHAGEESTPEGELPDGRGAGSEQITDGSKGRVAGVIATAAAVGAAAMAGIAAVAKGGAPETILTPGEKSDPEEELVEEEPQIMTSSRVSVHDKINSDHAASRSGSGSVRASSAQSVRLVDVSSTHSPSRSRGGSVASVEQAATARARSLTRPGSKHSTVTQETQTPRGTSPVPRMSTGSPTVRNSSSLSSRAARNSTADSISELGEQILDQPKSGSAPPAAVPERSSLRESLVPLSASAMRRENERTSHQAIAPAANNRPFALASPPMSKSSREPAPAEAKATPISSVQPSSGPKSLETGVPPLTPLREMMEGAHDTSDDASSMGASYRAQNGSSSTVSVSNLSHSQNSSEAKRSPEKPKTARRISPSQSQQDGDITPKAEASTRPGRQLHASSSSISSGSHKVRPIRTSEDSVPSPNEDKGRSFEQLIQSDQTIQYTLTPREIESPESPRSVSLPHPPGMQKGERPRTSSSASRLTALHSNPPPGKTSRPTPGPAANSGAKVRSRAPQARDARVDRDSIGDFAEFIRSTGPPGATYDAPPPKSTPAATAHRSQNSSARGPDTPASPRATTTNGASNGTVTRSQSSASRRLQAREAVVPFGDHSSDLIDFIRQGPPQEKTRDNPRIPRTVAPFRTTADSDQMYGAIGSRVGEQGHEERHSAASTNLSNEQSARSIQSSVNSQSALLSSYNQKKASPTTALKGFGEEDMMPKRKTRRVKDPYAIDLSDEDEEFAATKTKPAAQEESLADFLKNASPPSPTSYSVQEASPKAVSKKASAPSLISRLSRTTGSHSKSPSVQSNSGVSSRANNNTPKVAPRAPAHASKPSQSSQSPAKLAKTPTPNSKSNYVSRLDSERKPLRAAQKSFEPRDASGSQAVTRSATFELADFLKNTPPPPSNGPQRLSIIIEPKEEGGRFERMFGRRKKAAAA